MKFKNGHSVTTKNEYELRKKEIVDLFATHIYGSIPNLDYSVSFKTLESGTALNHKAIRKQIEITVKTENGTNKALLLLFTPKGAKSSPVFVGLNFLGNSAILNDPQIIPSYSRILSDGTIAETPGERHSRWEPEFLIEKGYALATLCAGDFAPDNKKNYDSRLIKIFGGDTKNSEFKTIAAWAFGLSRAIDYLITDSSIDKQRIISVGHSRLGKTSLWAGAQDKRITLAISNASGNSGAALARNSHKETIRYINFVFPYWFVNRYNQYSGKESKLPVDQHMLLASIFPRKVYVASCLKDQWADPYNEFMALKLMSEAIAPFGATPIKETTIPKAGSTLFSEYYGYHNKKGKHRINIEDWRHFIDYANQYLK